MYTIWWIYKNIILKGNFSHWPTDHAWRPITEPKNQIPLLLRTTPFFRETTDAESKRTRWRMCLLHALRDRISRATNLFNNFVKARKKWGYFADDAEPKSEQKSRETRLKLISNKHRDTKTNSKNIACVWRFGNYKKKVKPAGQQSDRPGPSNSVTRDKCELYIIFYIYLKLHLSLLKWEITWGFSRGNVDNNLLLKEFCFWIRLQKAMWGFDFYLNKIISRKFYY